MGGGGGQVETDIRLPVGQVAVKILFLTLTCTDLFVSDLFVNHIVGFPTRWLMWLGREEQRQAGSKSFSHQSSSCSLIVLLSAVVEI